MSAKNLLVELFVEELPPKSLQKLGESFAQGIFNGLIKHNLKLGPPDVQVFASPRRLGVSIPDVLALAPDRTETIKLMPVKVGLDESGKPTPALMKKLTSLGVDGVPELKRAMDGKAEALYFESSVKGATLKEGLQNALDEAIAKLPIAKVMTYPDPSGDGWATVNFVRPAHSLVALHGSEIVPVSVLGLQAGNKTKGHRFEATTETLVISDADSYEAQMENEGAVIASFAKRRDEIVHQLSTAAEKQGLRPVEDDALLDEVTSLVERPNVLVGTFEEDFLAVPQECLILTMKANQKYFPLLDAQRKLTNRFLIVSNIRPDDASLVIGGNERVVRPRLADAKFFFDQDRKKTLESRVLGLAKVVYHNKLGTQGERVQRVCAIAKDIGFQLGGDALAMQAEQAALLAKADLLTDMVGEFPELQGIMGRYYAQHDGLPDDIAFAIEDHYKPRFSGDELPRNEVGICVALADKLETLVGMFGIGQVPTGDKDPFALRRHALGIARMLIEGGLNLELKLIIQISVKEFENFAKTLPGKAMEEMSFNLRFQGAEVNGNNDIFNLIYERLTGYMREQGYTSQQMSAVFSLSPQRLSQVPNLLSAVQAFSTLPEADSLAAANKRIGNILKKAERDTALRQTQGVRIEVDVSLLKEPAESALHQALVSIKPKADAAFECGDYTASLQALASLKTPVDAFFDSVMVNAEDTALRMNRLALLLQLHQAMNRVADISRLAA